MSSNTPKAQAIGAALRKAREEPDLSMRDVAKQVGVSHVTLHRWETGQVIPKPEDIASVLTAVGARLQLRNELIALARDPDSQYWVAASLPDQQRQLATLLEIERVATRITTVSPLLVPGLLQTADYARAIMVAADVGPLNIDVRVAVRIGRREAITRDQPAQLRAVIGEWVLSHVIGGPEVMASQLRTITSLTERPNVDLRILPTRSDWHPALEGPFSLAEFADRTPVVHIENRRSGQFFHEPDDVAVYQVAADRVVAAALSPEDSLTLIADLIEGRE